MDFAAVNPINVDTVNIELFKNLEIIINLIYPISSIVIYDKPEIDPNKLYANTKWERIENRFLFSHGVSVPIIKEGGNSSITLKQSNLPSHSHTINHKHNRGNMEITGKFIQGAWDNIEFQGAFQYAGYKAGKCASGRDDRQVCDFKASRAWTGETSQPDINNSGNTGNNEPINIMPSFYSVFAWKRIK